MKKLIVLFCFLVVYFKVFAQKDFSKLYETKIQKHTSNQGLLYFFNDTLNLEKNIKITVDNLIDKKKCIVKLKKNGRFNIKEKYLNRDSITLTITSSSFGSISKKVSTNTLRDGYLKIVSGYIKNYQSLKDVIEINEKINEDLFYRHPFIMDILTSELPENIDKNKPLLFISRISGTSVSSNYKNVN